MPDQQPPGEAEVLASLVPDEHIAAYVRLRERCGGIPKDQAAEFLGGAGLVKELIDAGLVYVMPRTGASPATVRAAPLDFALMGVLANLAGRLAQEQELLREGNRKLRQCQALAPRADAVPEHLLKVLTGDEALAMSAELIASARSDWMVMDNGLTDMPITDDYALNTIPALSRLVRQRTIYDAAVTANPAAMRCIELSVAAGEEARILPSVGIKLIITDATAVMLSLGRTGQAGAVLFYAEPVVELARDCFEMKWARATSIGSGARKDAPLSKEALDVLEQLAAGKTNESVAAFIGKSEKTVQRHLDDVKELLELKSVSKFSLGFAVGRSGLLGTRSASQAGTQARTQDNEEHHG
ncbi:MAG TPA: LuxR C-terminal-related transcriptional regulator [Streptosporangiaceae bacterium]|nr:LuxR C-terminal-related transcriptional regulator [Streptosporangiaceae bacterium]